jgi:hypothetical protein
MTIAPGTPPPTPTASLLDLATGLQVLRSACGEAAVCYRRGDFTTAEVHVAAIVNGLAIAMTAAGHAAPHVRFATEDGGLSGLASTTAGCVRRMLAERERHAWGAVADLLEQELASMIADWVAALDGALPR